MVPARSEGNGSAFLADPKRVAELRAIAAQLARAAPEGGTRSPGGTGGGTGGGGGGPAGQSLRDVLRALPQTRP